MDKKFKTSLLNLINQKGKYLPNFSQPKTWMNKSCYLQNESFPNRFSIMNACLV